MALGKSKGHLLQQVFFFAGSNNQSANSSTTKHYSSTVQPTDKALFISSASGKNFQRQNTIPLQYHRQIFQQITATFRESRSNYQKQTTSRPNSRHLFLQNIKPQ